MDFERNATGFLQVDAAKFPLGFPDLTAYIHGLGLKAGLYTSKSALTCQGRAASCGHEVQDAALFASWEVDYVKEDSCGPCPLPPNAHNDTAAYIAMWEAIEQSGRPMVLTDEGRPDISAASRGGLGNALRVGHDINPTWISLLTLLDIAAPLWPYAHNASDARYGGFWNDIDMLVMGDGPDFLCDDASSPLGLTHCQSHFALWCALKAPLLLGTNISSLGPGALAVLSNAEALAISQDALGLQARRLAVQPPRSTLPGPSANDNAIVAVPCDSADPTQQWSLAPATPGGGQGKVFLAAAPCAAASQQLLGFSPATGALTSPAFPGVCLTALPLPRPWWGPSILEPCNASNPQQRWAFDAATGVLSSAITVQAPGACQAPPCPVCLSLPYAHSGPVVSACAPAPAPAAQVWAFAAAAGGGAPSQLVSLYAGGGGVVPGGTCAVAARNPLPPGSLSTRDASGAAWCVGWQSWPASFSIPCSNASGAWPPNGGYGVDWEAWDSGLFANASSATLFLGSTARPEPWQQWAGGPEPSSPGLWPHAVMTSGNGGGWRVDAGALASGAPVRFEWPYNLTDDDMVGGVASRSGYCMAVRSTGALEVWGGQLSGGRYVALLLNRSPAPDTITLHWAYLGLANSTRMAVRDVWAAADRGVAEGVYTAQDVPSHGTALLVLTPA